MVYPTKTPRKALDQTLSLGLEEDQDAPISTSEKILALLPKDYLTSPFFAACPQTSGREVLCKGKLYQIGGFKAFNEGPVLPALDVRHATLLLALMSFWNLIDASATLKVTWGQLSNRLGMPKGGKSLTVIRALLNDLWGTAVRVRYKNERGDPQTKTYRIIEAIDEEVVLTSNHTERQLKSIAFTQPFLEILRDVAQVMHSRVDVITSIKSPIAKAIYLYLPSRAVHYSAKTPFQIKTKTLFRDIGIASESDLSPGGKYAFKSVRLKVLTQKKRDSDSVFEQCDGAEVLIGTLQLKLARNEDGSPKLSKDDGDFMLETWVDKDCPSTPFLRGDYKMLNAWLDSGRSEQAFYEACPAPLNPYEEQSLETAGVSIERTRRFLERSKALIPDFEVVIGSLADEVRTASTSTTNVIKSPTAVIVHRLLQRLSAAKS